MSSLTNPQVCLSRLKKHRPVSPSGYGTVFFLLWCTHLANQHPNLYALEAGEIAVVTSPQAVPAVKYVREQILRLCLFHFRKEFNCLNLKVVHGKPHSSPEVCVYLWISTLSSSC